MWQKMVQKGDGGGSAEKGIGYLKPIVSQAQISTKSAYVYPTWNENLFDYNAWYIRLSDDSTQGDWVLISPTTSDIQLSTPNAVKIAIKADGKGISKVTYSVGWKNFYVDIKAINLVE